MAQNIPESRQRELRERKLREQRRRKRERILKRRRMMLGGILLLIAVLVLVIIVSAVQKSRANQKDMPAANMEQQNNYNNVLPDVPDTTAAESDDTYPDEEVVGITGDAQYTVVIDPGHGGKDTGGEHGGIIEKDLVLSIGLKLRTELEKRGLNVIMTREDDFFIYLNRRTELAETEDADLFISIHTDSYEDDNSVSGLTVHYQYQADDRSAFAALVRDNIAEAEIIRVRDLKNTDLYVLRNTTMMSTLIECGYLSNSGDLEKLQNEEFQQQLAKIIADSVVEYFEPDSAVDSVAE